MSSLDIDAIREDVLKSQDPTKLLELALQQAETNPQEMRRDIRLLDPTCVDTKKVITLKLGKEEFKPSFAYQIFTADYVRGYKNPKILIEFDPVCLLALVEFKFDARVNDSAPDVLELLKQWLPADSVYNDRDEWNNQVTISRKDLENLTYKSLSIDRSDLKLAVFKFSSSNNAFLRRAFTFSWFFIEGASAPDETDTTWDIFVVTDAKTNEFRGYSSVYSFFYYSSAAEFESNTTGKLLRKRIAHFLILPPFQGQGIGKLLYLTLLQNFVKDSKVKQIEVEEPSLGFEVLRDRVHYSWLSSEAQSLLEDMVDNSSTALSKLVSMYKMDAVQFQRCSEMLEFMNNGKKETRTLKKMIKSRLYKHNYEELREMDPATQREQLHNVYESALHMHKVILHLEEMDGNEDEDEDDCDEAGDIEDELMRHSESLFAELVQSDAENAAGREIDSLADSKRRKLD